MVFFHFNPAIIDANKIPRSPNSNSNIKRIGGGVTTTGVASEGFKDH